MSEITHPRNKNTPAATGVSNALRKANQMLRKHISSPGVSDTLDQLRTTISDKDMWDIEDIRPYISTVSRNTYFDHALAALDHLGNEDDHVHIEARGGGELYFLDREVFELVSQSLDAPQEVQDYFAPPKPSIRERLAAVSQSEASAGADLVPFSNDEFTLDLIPDGDSFKVVAPELARSLGFAEAATMTRNMPEDEKGSVLVQTPGGEQRVGFVTEAGFYRAIGQRQAARITDPEIRSKVERFQSWVYGTVLPEIRKTGSYGTPTVDPAQVSPRQLALAVLQAEDRADRAEEYARELEPKAEYVNTYVAGSDHVRFSAVASTHEMKEKDLRQLLIDEKWIYREETTRWSDTQKKKVPHVRYSEYAHKKPFFYRSLNHDAPRFGGEVMHTLKITAEGAAAIDRLIRRKRNALDLDVSL